MPLAALHKPIYECRIRKLTALILDEVKDGDTILDIGSGFGALGKSILAGKGERQVEVQGIEKHPRGGEEIKTIPFDGYTIPSPDNHYDIVILADVVHHEEDYMRLLSEATRVTKRALIIKDHTPKGILGQQRISFMDWAANNPYGVKCLYRYFSVAEWHEIYQDLDLTVEREIEAIDLYPPVFNFVFGKKLQYFVVLSKQTE